jgi:hypothetical protein
LSRRGFHWRSAPDRWSIGQCVDHPASTDDRMLPGIERAIVSVRGTRLGNRGPFYQKRTRGVAAPRFEFVSRWFASA